MTILRPKSSYRLIPIHEICTFEKKTKYNTALNVDCGYKIGKNNQCFEMTEKL
jgi:hypothetical protein